MHEKEGYNNRRIMPLLKPTFSGWVQRADSKVLKSWSADKSAAYRKPDIYRLRDYKIKMEVKQMDMFGRATKVVKEVGENVIDSAKSIGTSIYSTSKEQSELAGMKVQKSVIERRLEESYAKIGKRYVEYMNQSDGSDAFDIADILEEMKPDFDKLDEIISTLQEKENEAKREEEEKRRKKALDEYESQKAKLDKALEMEIITAEEYDEKIAVIQKKYENYDQLRKIDMQLQMGIITNEEHTAKVNNILG